jgi:hypothetical protein
MPSLMICPRCNSTVTITMKHARCTDKQCYFEVDNDSVKSPADKERKITEARATAILQTLAHCPRVEDIWEFLVNVDFPMNKRFFSYLYFIASTKKKKRLLFQKITQLEHLVIPQ